MTVKSWAFLFSNYLAFAVIALLTTSLQTTFWMQLMGYFSPPQFWISILSFWSIYRRPRETLVMVYLITLIVAPFTALPINILFFVHLLLTLSIYFFRQRIFWGGVTYFMMVSTVSCLAFPLFHGLISFLIETHPISSFEFIDWILRALLTALFSVPLYFLYLFVDEITQKEWPAEMGTQLL